MSCPGQLKTCFGNRLKKATIAKKTVSMDRYSLTQRNSKKEDPGQIDRIGVKWDIGNDLGNTSFHWRCDPMLATF